MNKRQRNKWHSIYNEIPRYRHYPDFAYGSGIIKKEFKGLYRKRFNQALKDANLPNKEEYDELHYWDHVYLFELLDSLDHHHDLMNEYDKLEEELYPNKYRIGLNDFNKAIICWLSNESQFIPVIVAYLDWMRHNFATSKVTQDDLQVSRQIKKLMIVLSNHDWDQALDAFAAWPGWWN